MTTMRWIAMVAAAWGLSAAANAPTPELGRLYTSAGRVELVRAGRTTAARAAEPIVRGDEVRAGAEARATVFFFAGGRRWSLPVGARVRIGAGGPERIAGPAPTAVGALASAGRVVAAGDVGASRRTLAARVRAGDPGLAPVGAVRPGPVTLTWRTIGRPDRIDVRTEDEAGRTLWRAELPGDATSAVLSEAAAPAGRWVRVVLGQIRADEVLALGRVTLRRMTEAEGAALAAAEAEARTLAAQDPLAGALLAADIYEAAELPAEAGDALARAMRLRPDDAGLRARREALRRRLGG